MDLFTLSATLGLDTSGFTSGLSGAEALVNSAVPGLGTALGGLGTVATKALSAAGSATVDFAKSVWDTGLNFEKEMSGVYAVTDATEEYRQTALKTAVINEAMSSSFTTAEVASAAYYEGLAGYSDSEIMEGLHGIVVAAEASGEGLQTTADIITDTVRAFGDTAAEQEHYADVFAATATNTNTTIGKMGQAMKYVAPIAGALGYSVEDVAISLGIMADNGIKGSQAGTTLRSVFQRLATDTGATSNSFGALGIMTEKLGVDFYDSEGKVRPLIEVLKEARASWKGFTDEQKNTAAEAFGEISSGAETSTDSLQAFVSEVANLNSDLTNGKISIYEYESSIDALSSEFSILGIEVKKSNGEYRDSESLLDQVTAKVNGLSDAQQIGYSKQIAGQRGMSGWLALMNATEEKFDDTTDAIYNCAGAADRMRNTRLGSNLYGDIEQLNSRINALKTLIFGKIEGPARDLAKFAIEAIDSINKAIEEGGLEGGIDELAVQLEKAAEKLSPIIESIGNALAPLVTSLITKVAPQLMSTALSLGNSLATGLLTGLSGVLTNTDNPLLKYIGESLTTAVDTWKYGMEHSLSDNLSLTGTLGAFTVDAQSVDVNQHLVDMIQAKIDEAVSSGKNTVKIGDLEFSTDYTAKQIADAITEGAKNGSAEAKEVLNSNVSSAAQTSKTTLTSMIFQGISGGSASGAISMVSSVTTNMTTGANNVLRTLYNAISNAGNSGGDSAASNVQSHFSRRSYEIKNTLASNLGTAGNSAGRDIASGIQNSLNLWKFGISIVGTLTGIFSGSKKYASAMHNGRILHGATIFGVDGDGDALIGGDAGPEAIIGTDELSRLISKAVGAGGGDTYNTINIYQQPGQDPKELAEIIQRELVRIGRQQKAVYA